MIDRFHQFQDTKATNAFAFICSLIMIISIIFLHFFHVLTVSVRAMNAISIILHSTDLAFVLSCQICLFLPKVLPPFRRCIFRDEVKSKPHLIPATL